MNIEAYKQSPAGRLVQVWQADSSYWAFVPKPLPPVLTFDYELINALSEADRTLGELAGLGRLLSDPAPFTQPLMRCEAVASLRLDGIRTSLTDLYAFEAQQLSLFGGSESPQRRSAAQEAANYVSALQFGLERLKILPLSLLFIRELHQRLMKDARGGQARPGDFRDRQNYLGAPGCTLSEATYVPPPVEQLAAALNAFETYLYSSDSLPPLIRLACVHYQLDAIHPFLSGNGRLERLLIALLLNAWQLLPAPLLYLSAYFARERQTYYDLLQGVSERGEWGAWLLFFLRGVADQANDALTMVKRLQDLQQRWHQAVRPTRSSTSLMRLVDRLFQSPIVTIPDVERSLVVTSRDAKSLVQKLVDAQILSENEKYRKTYVAIDLIRSVEED
jgi:Fic family protein